MGFTLVVHKNRPIRNLNAMPKTMVMAALMAAFMTQIPAPALGIEEGDPAPDFVLVDLLTQEPFTMEEFRGQVVVINFWAYW